MTTQTLPMDSRRQFLVCAAAVAASATLAACGFHRRGVANLPFKKIWINQDRNSTLGSEIARGLEASSNVETVEKKEDAEVLLEITKQQRSSGVSVINSQGRAREYELRYTIGFRLRAPDGFELIPQTEVTASRDLSVSESDHLARESNIEMLYADMTREVISLMVMKISRTKLNVRPAP